MLELALRDLPTAEISTVELERGGVTAQLLTLGITLIVVNTLWQGPIAWGAGAVRRADTALSPGPRPMRQSVASGGRRRGRAPHFPVDRARPPGFGSAA